LSRLALTRVAGSVLLSATLVFASASSALAHAFSNSLISLTFANAHIVGRADVLTSEVDLETSAETNLAEIIEANLTLTADNKNLAIKAAWIDPQAGSPSQSTADYSSVVFVTEDLQATPNSLSLEWKFSASGASVLFSTADASLFGTFDSSGVVTFNSSPWSSFSSFFSQGIQHIAFGLDHLLFLVVLALGSFRVATNRTSAILTVKLLTAFTVGHAVSFTLAYFKLLEISTNLVEPIIAISILLTAAAALLKISWDKYWILAGLVGLVHGLGFASSLAGLGIVTSQHALAIAGFNLGVDLAQLIVVTFIALALALIRKILPSIAESLRFTALIAAGLVGFAWFIERAFGQALNLLLQLT
jgi:HupE / UreJ protein